MAIYWPTELQNANMNVSCTPRNNSIFTKMSTGYDKVRPKFTKRYRDYSVEVEMTIVQYDVFLRFFHEDLGYGELNFFFPDPLLLGDYIDVWVKTSESEQPFDVSPWSGTDSVVVSFELEEEDFRIPTGSPLGAWPTQLPPLPLHNSFSQSEQSGLIRDSGDTGKISIRRRFTATTVFNQVSMILDKEQLLIFEAFFADQGFGAIPFNIEAPLYQNGSVRVRWGVGDTYTIEYQNDSLDYLVRFSFDELPGQNKALPFSEIKATSDYEVKETTRDEVKETTRS